jgi:hypothetical protein
MEGQRMTNLIPLSANPSFVQASLFKKRSTEAQKAFALPFHLTRFTDHNYERNSGQYFLMSFITTA